MSIYRELLAVRAQLDQQIQEALDAERGRAIAAIRQMMSAYGITIADLENSRKQGLRRPYRGVPAKYRDPLSEKTWSGRGRAPSWMLGDRSRYLIPAI